MRKTLLLSVSFTVTVTLVTLVIPAVLAVSSKPAESALAVRKIHQAATCGSVFGSQWIGTATLAEKVYEQLHQGVITDTRSHPPDINYATHALLLVSMGQRTTGGYSVTLASDHMQVSDIRARLSVNWIEAKPGMMTIQMLTNPCLLLEVPRGSYDFIDVVDTAGKVRQSLALQVRDNGR